ncbi:MAG: hypothetical protein M3Y08_17260 [Fibrobacterota bacterium]|nr:hypothetical protein [Fibrobacterota bacterium]
MNAVVRTAGPWRKSLAAGRANLLPGLVLQAFALALLVAYYFHEPSHQAMDGLAGLKSRWGWIYSFFATAVFGGLIPFLYLRLNPRTRAATPLSHGVFYLLFWAIKGVEVDYFYQAQGWMFGNDTDFSTIAAKVLFDQLIYSVLWATPFTQLVFYWKDAGFSFARLRELRWFPFWKENMPKTVITLWVVWFPAIILIYSLPPALQIPLFNIVLCFYVLLFITVNRDNADVEAAPATRAPRMGTPRP